MACAVTAKNLRKHARFFNIAVRCDHFTNRAALSMMPGKILSSKAVAPHDNEDDSVRFSIQDRQPQSK
jgi:hypothetical protein